jgi:glutamate/tyrosine decarboxylase-like PLP-dependent enzyme
LAQAAGAWVHVDAAFGLWALASPTLAHLAEGFRAADSIGTDAHKWLNVPYDSGIAFCRHREALLGAMSSSPAAYLDMMASERREPDNFTPEMSRRGRGIEIWAALHSLGRSGVAGMIERCCALARRFAEGLGEAGFTVHNDVVLNQVVVSFGDAERTLDVIRRVQEDGTMWAGSTVWKGLTAMRISVSNWATTEEDIDLSLAAVVRAAG